MRLPFIAALFLALVLPAFADDAAVDALVRQLGSDEAVAREEAEAKLVALGAEPEARLRALAKEAEPEVKARIERVLDGIAAERLKATDLIHERDIAAGPGCELEAESYSPDGSVLAVSIRGLRTWTTFVDLETGTSVDVARQIRVFPGRKCAEFLSFDGTEILAWDGRTGKETRLADIRHPEHKCERTFVSPDGTLGWCDGYELPRKSLFCSFTDAPAPAVSDDLGALMNSPGRWSPDSQYVALDGRLDWAGRHYLLAVVRRDGKVVLRQDLPCGSNGMVWSPDSKLLYWTCEDKLHVFNPAGPEEVRCSDFTFRFLGFLDEKRALASELEGKLHLLYAPTLAILKTWDFPKGCYSLISPDRKRIIILTVKAPAVDVRRFEFPKAK